MRWIWCVYDKCVTVVTAWAKTAKTPGWSIQLSDDYLLPRETRERLVEACYSPALLIQSFTLCKTSCFFFLANLFYSTYYNRRAAYFLLPGQSYICYEYLELRVVPATTIYCSGRKLLTLLFFCLGIKRVMTFSNSRHSYKKKKIGNYFEDLWIEKNYCDHGKNGKNKFSFWNTHLSVVLSRPWTQ